MVWALLQCPLLVFLCLAVADVQCGGGNASGPQGVGGTVFFPQRHTFLEVLWSICTPRLILVYMPLLVCPETGPGL